MKIEIFNSDIKRLEKALKEIEKIECYMMFNKSSIMLDICEAINILKDKRDKQNIFINNVYYFKKL